MNRRDASRHSAAVEYVSIDWLSMTCPPEAPAEISVMRSSSNTWHALDAGDQENCGGETGSNEPSDISLRRFVEEECGTNAGENGEEAED